MRYKSPVKVREIKKDLNLLINLKNRLFKNRLDFARIYRNACDFYNIFKKKNVIFFTENLYLDSL
jgi:hypothetical protein